MPLTHLKTPRSYKYSGQPAMPRWEARHHGGTGGRDGTPGEHGRKARRQCKVNANPELQDQIGKANTRREHDQVKRVARQMQPYSPPRQAAQQVQPDMARAAVQPGQATTTCQAPP